MSKVIIDIEIEMGRAVEKVAELDQELNKHKQTVKDLKMTNEQNTTKYMDAQKRIALLKDEIKGYNQIVSQQAKQINATKGSMTELSAQVALNKKAYRDLSEEERNSAEIGGKLLQTIKLQDAEIKRLDASIGNHQRNVGDYKNAMKAAEMGLGDMKKELIALRNIQGATAEDTKLIEKRMGELTDAMSKAQQRIKVQAMDALPALVGSLQDVIGATQVFIGAYSLVGQTLGMSDEKVKKLAATMTQLIGVMQALTVMQQRWASGAMQANFMKTAMVIKTAAIAVAQKVATAATWLWTVAMHAFGKAMMAIPIFAFIAALGALATGIAFLIKRQKEESESAREARIQQEALTKAREEAYKQVSKSIVQTQLLIKVIQDENNSMELRKEKLAELNEVMGTNLSLTDNLAVATKHYIDTLMMEKELEIITDRMAELNAEMNNTYELAQKEAPGNIRKQLIGFTTGWKMLAEGVTIFSDSGKKMLQDEHHTQWVNNISAASRDLKTEYESLFGRATELIEGTTEVVESHIVSIDTLRIKFDETYKAAMDLVEKTAKKTEEINKDAFKKQSKRIDDEAQREKQKHEQALKEAQSYTAAIIAMGKSEEQKNKEKYESDLKMLDSHLEKEFITEQEYIDALKVVKDNWKAYEKTKQDEELLMHQQMNVLKAMDDAEMYKAKREQLEAQMEIELSTLEEGTVQYALKHLEYLKLIEEHDNAHKAKLEQAQKDFNTRLAELRMENYETLDELDQMQRDKLEEQKQLDIEKERERYEAGLIDFEQFKMMEYEIELNYAKKREELERQVSQRKLSEYAKFINAAKGLSNSLMEMEMNNAGESEEAKKRVKKKYANINAMISLGETAISTAQGMMGATAAMPGPAGIVLAALIGIMGAAQAALILSERSKIQGLATGGYVTRGGVFEVGERGREQVYLPAGASVMPSGMTFGSAIPGVPQFEQGGSNASDMMEIMRGWQPVVAVEEILNVENQFNNRVNVAQL